MWSPATLTTPPCGRPDLPQPALGFGGALLFEPAAPPLAAPALPATPPPPAMPALDPPAPADMTAPPDAVPATPPLAAFPAAPLLETPPMPTFCDPAAAPATADAP